MLDEKIEEIFREIKEKPSEWLPKNVHKARHILVTTHPCKFSHPSAEKKVTPVICDAPYTNDGLLRCGNVRKIENDAICNAAYLKIHKFLDTRLTDGKRVIEHIRDNTPIGQAIIQSAQSDDETVREGFLKMLEPHTGQTVTSSKIKQVYFPVNDNAYHLLSILTFSGAVFRLKELIDQMHFSDEAKEARDARRQNKKGKDHRDLFELTILSYGGKKPQNVSPLNNRFGGRTYLLRSMPPTIKKRDIRFPKKDFFEESLPYKKTEDVFKALTKLYEANRETLPIKEGRKRRYQQLINMIIETMWLVRSAANEQYYAPASHLPDWQQIWLLDDKREERLKQEHWLEELIGYIGRWIVAKLEKISKKGLEFNDYQYNDIVKLLSQYKEDLR